MWVLNWALARSILTNLTWSLDPSHCLHFSALSFQLFFHAPPFLLLANHILFLPLSRPCILSASITHSTCSVSLCPNHSLSLCALTRIFKLLPHLTSSPSQRLSSPVILPSRNHPVRSPAPLSLLSVPQNTPPPPHPPKPLRSCEQTINYRASTRWVVICGQVSNNCIRSSASSKMPSPSLPHPVFFFLFLSLLEALPPAPPLPPTPPLTRQRWISLVSQWRRQRDLKCRGSHLISS